MDKSALFPIFEERHLKGMVLPAGPKLDFSNDHPSFSPIFQRVFSRYGGVSIADGALRIHSFESARKWTREIKGYFPSLTEMVVVFAFDWMGRQFAADPEGNNVTWIFDPATGEHFRADQGIDVFFEEDLGEYWEETIVEDSFRQLLGHGSPLAFNECLGHNIPLFLGGKDDASNIGRTDIEVYWELHMQLLRKIRQRGK